ncbi:MAG: hypothetical protein WD140_01535 [bacterium]
MARPAVRAVPQAEPVVQSMAMGRQARGPAAPHQPAVWEVSMVQLEAKPQVEAQQRLLARRVDWRVGR